jgi:gentisate 1,2-dioxygenase
MEVAMQTQPERNAEREKFYERISGNSLAPLWEVLRGLLPSEPRPREVPFIWRYDEVRPLLMEAGSLITAKEADRRVLVLENPALRGESRITHSLYAGLQLIMPGEIAPSHRHTQTALRFIVEGEGAYTAVNGERTIMKPGDFVITPSWCWHDHGNESNQPMVWVDGLDIPIIDLFNAGFYEGYPEDRFPITQPDGDSYARYGEGLVPLDFQRASKSSPILNYSYDRTREALTAMARCGAWDPCHGLKLRYVDPTTGDFAIPTLGTFIQLLPKGFNGTPYRSTDGTVFVAAEGSGKTVIAGEVFSWKEHDVFVVPSWQWYYHLADEESVLFSYSDRPIHEKLGLFREQRGKAA